MPRLTHVLALSTASLLTLACGGFDQADTMGGAGADAGEHADSDDSDADAGGDTGSDGGDAGQEGGGGDDDGGNDPPMAADGDGGGGEGGGSDCDAEDPCDCPDSAETLSGQCDDEEQCLQWAATEADAHPIVALHAGGHAIVADGFFCDGGAAVFSFEDVVLDANDDGARMTGTAIVESGGCGGAHDGDVWQLDVRFEEGPASMLPKRELANPDSTQPALVTDQWLYFAFSEGQASLTHAESGSSATLSHRPSDLTYGFQVGYTANGKNLKFGASGWFHYEYEGECGVRTGTGDFNLNLHGLCR